MVVRRLGYILLLSFLLLVPSAVQAFHIAGGDLTTRWISGNLYEVKLTLYRDCSNPSGAPYDQEITVSVYRKIDDQLLDTLHMSLDQTSVNALQLTGAACVSPPQVCMQTGSYHTLVNLPDDPGGYYLVWERCCRNNTIVNLVNPQAAGMAFYMETADPVLHNSSPVFNGAPTPFICAGQFFRIPFNATDADGDSLVYALSEPLDGGHTSNTSPNPFSPLGNDETPPAQPYTTTQWNAGFSLSNVCGSSQPMTINSQTGVVEGVADLQGIYAMAVTVYEYRNGVLIGEVRREIEFTVIVCVGNNPPNVSPNILSKDYELHATDTLSFEVTTVDPDGDSLFLTHYGEVFPGMAQTTIGAPFAFGVDTAGNDTLHSPFYWIPACDQWRDSAFIVTYEIHDNGCPLPLTVRGTFRIHILPVPPVYKQNLICMKIENDSVVRLEKAPDSTIIPRYFNLFTLYRSTNGDAFTPLSTTSDPSGVGYIDSTAFDARHTNYCYYLRGLNTCGEEGTPSDTMCTVDYANIQKTYIHSVSVENNQQIRIMWEHLSDPEFRTYQLFKSEAHNQLSQAYTPLLTLQHYTADEWVDTLVLPKVKSYCYIITNTDHCGNESPVSDAACSILLQGRAEYYAHYLNWSPYINWKGGVATYMTERSDINVNIPYRTMIDVPPYDTSTVDANLNTASAQYYYRIHALEGSGGESAESYSNEILLSQSPVIYIPNAFTPNADTHNDVWGPKSSFVNSFEIFLYNRFGQLVWYSNNPASAWDGKLNGLAAPEGVYCFYYKFTGYDDQTVFDKAGTVSLIR